MLKTILLSLAALSIVAGVGLAWAKHRGDCTEGARFGNITDRVARKLELTDSQKQKLESLTEVLRDRRSQWIERRSALREEVDGLLAAEKLDRERARELIDERHQAFMNRERELIDSLADFTDALEPDQRNKLAALIGKRMDRRSAHFDWSH